MHILTLIRSLLKKGYATAAEKKQVADGVAAADAETQEALKDDAAAVGALPDAPAAPAPEDAAKEQEELEKGIKALVTASTKAAATEAVEAMKSEVKTWLESQKEAMEKKAGIYHPEVQEKRAKVNTYIRDLSKALLSNDSVKVKELTTDDTGSPFGGHVVDSELSAEIRHLTTEYGVARREMSTIQLSKNSYRANELVTDVTIFWVDEGTAIGSTQVVLDQETLELKKLGAIVALTRELLQDQEVDLFAFIGTRIAEGFARAEDEMAFIGDGTSTYGGFTGIMGATGIREVEIEDRTATSQGDGTSILHMRADDLFNMIAASHPSVRRTGKFYAEFSAMGVIRKLKDADGAYIYQAPSQAGPATVWGRPVVEVEVLPGTADDAEETAFVGYGDLKKSSIFGYRGGMSMDRFNAGVVRNVANNADINLITTDREAIRWVERVGVLHIIPSAFTVLKTQAGS
ncbi:MAG: phage major capsid protein [Thalassobaculum sp.]|uniref:phage major capsid protein n=1 Tax=Thalassobaculum sp. TaxID=2022740 RepID=UPI0032ED9CF2